MLNGVCNQSLFFRFKEQNEKVYMSHFNENLDGSSAAAKNHLIRKWRKNFKCVDLKFG